MWPKVALAWIIARRLALREHAAPKGVRRFAAAAAGLTGVGMWGVFGGGAHWGWVLLAGVGSLAMLAGVALRAFPAAMAVSVTGIALSCASLMTVLAVTTGFEQAVVRAVAGFNGHVLVTKYGLDFREYEALRSRWIRDNRVTAASPFAFSMVAVVRAGDAAHPDPRGPAVVVGKGIDPRWAAGMEGVRRAFGRGDLTALRPGSTGVRPGLVLGDALAKRVGVGVGDTVRVVVPAALDGRDEGTLRPPRHAEFELLDLLHSGTSELDRNLALMHLTAAQALFFRQGRVTGIEVQLADPREASEVAAALADELGFPYRTSTWEQTQAPVLAGLRQVRLGLSVVLGLMAVVAAASLVASLLLIVRRSRHGIGVILALGGDRALVFGVFECVGLLAGGCGAGLGLSLGGLYCAMIGAYRYPLAGGVYPVDHVPVALQATDALGPAGIAIGLCALASGPVAVQASRTGLLRALAR